LCGVFFESTFILFFVFGEFRGEKTKIRATIEAKQTRQNKKTEVTYRIRNEKQKAETSVEIQNKRE